MEFTALPRFSGPEAVCTPMGNLHSVATLKLSHLSDIWPSELGIDEDQASERELEWEGILNYSFFFFFYVRRNFEMCH